MLEAAELMIQKLGIKAPYAPRLLKLITETDKERVNETDPETGEQYKYSMRRFPSSLVVVYLSLCDDAKVVPDDQVVERLYEIGMKAFDEKRFRENIKDHTEKVLSYISSHGDIVILVTKGDKEVQQRKVQVFEDEGLDFFDEVVLVEHSKSPGLFERLLNKYQAGSGISLSVGNNYHKDIVPALKAGVTGGIYIPEFTWEEKTPDKTDERCITLSKLENILKLYPRLSETFE